MTHTIQDLQTAEVAVKVPVIAMSAFDSLGDGYTRTNRDGSIVEGREYLFNGTNGFPGRLSIERSTRKGATRARYSVQLSKVVITTNVDDEITAQNQVLAGMYFEVPIVAGAFDLAGVKAMLGNVYSATFVSSSLVGDGDPGLTTLQQWFNGIFRAYS